MLMPAELLGMGAVKKKIINKSRRNLISGAVLASARLLSPVFS